MQLTRMGCTWGATIRISGHALARLHHSLIGISCYNRFELAQQAASGADYVAFGSFFASVDQAAGGCGDTGSAAPCTENCPSRRLR